MAYHDTLGTGTTARWIRRHRGDRLLRSAALVFFVGFLVHNADHSRRGLAVLTPEVIAAGTAGAILSLGALALIAMGHRLAPTAAIAAGISMAIGVTAVHLLPRWSAFSDALPGGNVDAWTWLAVFAEVAGALFLALAGLYALRRGAT
jgi:hypothetical protein